LLRLFEHAKKHPDFTYHVDMGLCYDGNNNRCSSFEQLAAVPTLFVASQISILRIELYIRWSKHKNGTILRLSEFTEELAKVLESMISLKSLTVKPLMNEYQYVPGRPVGIFNTQERFEAVLRNMKSLETFRFGGVFFSPHRFLEPLPNVHKLFIERMPVTLKWWEGFANSTLGRVEYLAMDPILNGPCDSTVGEDGEHHYLNTILVPFRMNKSNASITLREIHALEVSEDGKGLDVNAIALPIDFYEYGTFPPGVRLYPRSKHDLDLLLWDEMYADSIHYSIE
jgi:hypothetical protein